MSFSTLKNNATVFAVVATLFILVPVDFARSAEFDLAKYFKRSDQRAVELYEQGQHEQAAAGFENPQWRGVSRFRAENYQEAMQDFALTEDATGLYNHGTAAVRAGDYTQAVSSFEQALQLAPENQDIAHNLDIARKLRDLAENQPEEQQEDQQQDGEQDEQQEGEESESSENESGESEDDQSQDAEEGQSEQGQSEQNGNESQQSESDGDNADSQNSGELNADESNQSQPEDQEQQQQDEQALREMMQQQQQAGETPPDEENLAEVTAPSEVSEDDQATEQWLRRIPDDASQLLRNKIRLNHIIEYPDVQDMQEPW